MIKEMARMRFQSARSPHENGALIITDDGFLQIEPSEHFLIQLADIEDKAVERSRTLGMRTALALFGLGALAAIAAWLYGRIGGEVRQSLMIPRPIDVTRLDTSEEGGVRVTVPGVGPQKITLEWEKGEFDECEAARFVAAYERFKNPSVTLDP